MREFRNGKNCTEHYSSFAEMRTAFGLKEIVKRTKDEQKLQKQKEAFYSRHICKACGTPMTFVNGTNVMCCTNEKCNGIKHQMTNEDTGEIKVWYTPSCKTLDGKSASIANNIFCDTN